MFFEPADEAKGGYHAGFAVQLHKLIYDQRWEV